MQKFNFSLAILFLLVNCTFSQISPEKIFYKSTEQTDLNLFIYNPVDFDKSQTYNCIVFFMVEVGIPEIINNLKGNQYILHRGEWLQFQSNIEYEINTEQVQFRLWKMQNLL